jgi:hypothetical protein
MKRSPNRMANWALFPAPWAGFKRRQRSFAAGRVDGAVDAGLAICKMMVHLGVQRPLGQRFLQIVQKAVRIKGRLRISATKKRCNQESFLLAGQLAPRARARLFTQGRLQTALHQPTLGAVDRRAAGADRSLDLLIADAVVGGQEDLRPLQP